MNVVNISAIDNERRSNEMSGTNEINFYNLTYDDVSGATSFDAGDEFYSAQDVQSYFTVENMRFMFSTYGHPHPTDDISQDQLDAMADAVIENRWHCAEDFAD